MAHPHLPQTVGDLRRGQFVLRGHHGFEFGAAAQVDDFFQARCRRRPGSWANGTGCGFEGAIVGGGAFPLDVINQIAAATRKLRGGGPPSC